MYKRCGHKKRNYQLVIVDELSNQYPSTIEIAQKITEKVLYATMYKV